MKKTIWRDRHWPVVLAAFASLMVLLIMAEPVKAGVHEEAFCTGRTVTSSSPCNAFESELEAVHKWAYAIHARGVEHSVCVYDVFNNQEKRCSGGAGEDVWLNFTATAQYTWPVIYLNNGKQGVSTKVYGWIHYQDPPPPSEPPPPPPPSPSAPIPGLDDNLGGPHGVAQANGFVDTFYRTSTGGLGHDVYLPWQGWTQETLPGSLAASAVPHPVVQSNGVIDVFYRTPTGGLGHNWFVPNEGGWKQNVLAGSVGSEPHPVVQANGTIDVFYRTPTGGLGHNYWTSTSGWGQEVLTGSVAGDPYPVGYGGTVDVFYRTPSGTLGHNWYTGSGWNNNTLAG